MFLHHILTRDMDTLISRVFWTQLHNTGKGDWCQVVREDLDTLGMDSLSFDDIKSMSKEGLKALVNNKINVTALRELTEEKNKLSKVSGLMYDKLDMQQYLLDEDFPTRLKQQAFKWRTRMIKVGWNYGKKGKCPICSDSDDTQSHLLECNALKTSEPASSGDADKEYNLALHMRRLEAAIRKREVILEEREKSEMLN